MTINSESRGESRKGLFIAVDGLDGIGKGEIERAIIFYEQKQGRAVLDTIAFQRARRKGLPELVDFLNPPEIYYDTLITAEPTYSGIGHVLRTEMIARNRRYYSAMSQIIAYGLDRLVQMKRVVIPALENGLNVIQSRCCAASLIYQSVTAVDEGKDPLEIRRTILEQEGNIYQLKNAPDLLIIPTIRDSGQLAERLKERGRHAKDDKAIFEEASFQARLAPLYTSDWLREIFESHGTVIKYVDAGISEEETRRQGRQAYIDFVENLRADNARKLL